MSLDLGTRHWSYVGFVNGFAMVTHRIEQKSRWVDLRTWPGKLLQIRDEYTRAVAPSLTLAGWKAQTVYSGMPDMKRTAIKLPKGTDFAAIGIVDGYPCVAPAPMIYNVSWQPLAGAGGSDPTAHAIAGDITVWNGRVLRFEGGKLVDTPAGDLPHGATSFCGDQHALYCAAGGALVCILREGKDREDRRIGKLAITGVMEYDGALLVGDGKKVWRYDVDSREHAPFDIIDHDALIAAPCGLVALVDSGRYLVRARV